MKGRDSRHRVRGLRARIVLTWAGMLTERLARLLWPAWCAALAAYVVWKLALLAGHGWLILAVLAAILAMRGLVRLQLPRLRQAADRMDARVPGRPILAIQDRQVAGLADPGAVELWRRHVNRMAEKARHVKPVPPDLHLSSADPLALRHISITAFILVALFVPAPSGNNAAGQLLPGDAGSIAADNLFDAWIDPPAHTGEPGIYLNEIATGTTLQVPAGSRLAIQLHRRQGELQIVTDLADASNPDDRPRQWEIADDGYLELALADQQLFRWEFEAIPDRPPSVTILRGLESGPFGQARMELEFEDDYGVSAAAIHVELDLAAIDRQHGLAADPEQRQTPEFRIPMPLDGQRRHFETGFTADFGDHPWAGLPVHLIVSAVDSAGQETTSRHDLPKLAGRVFGDPLSRALVEQRRDILWNRANSRRVSRVIRSISHLPDRLFETASPYLKSRMAVRLIESSLPGQPDDSSASAIADLLWHSALEQEEGDLAITREYLTEAAERLAEAIRNGASEQEINRLTAEYQRALARFMAELARKSAQEQASNPDRQSLGQFGETREISQSRIRQMMDDMARLLAEGNLAEANRILDQLRRITENLVAGRPGDPDNGGEFQETMRGFSGTLERQQGLADEAFRDLQEQRMMESAGRSEGNVGSGGGLGQGRDHFGQGGGSGGEGDVAERQEELRQQLRRQMRQLANQGIQGRDAIGAFEQSARSMTRARDRLRDNDFEQAIVEQSRAIGQLGQGIRSLMEQRASQNANGYGGPPGSGQTETDPLGRRRGQNMAGIGDLIVPDRLQQRRSQEIRDEIRRRAGEAGRPEFERDYLKRLLQTY